ncbi:hypothetical protein Trydic_g17517 [Trypoxylus dichotomus]
MRNVDIKDNLKVKETVDGKLIRMPSKNIWEQTGKIDISSNTPSENIREKGSEERWTSDKEEEGKIRTEVFVEANTNSRP